MLRNRKAGEEGNVHVYLIVQSSCSSSGWKSQNVCGAKTQNPNTLINGVLV